MTMKKSLVKIGEAAKLLGSTPDTLRRWEATGELLPHRKTAAGTRYYSVSELLGMRAEDSPTVGYAWVSSHDQKGDLDRQHAALWKPTAPRKDGGATSSAISAVG